jgi:hypothetical protein
VSAENQLSPQEPLDEKDEQRHREFAKWLNHGKRVSNAGHNVAWLKANLPPPHELDAYELMRAIEEGLA